VKRQITFLILLSMLSAHAFGKVVIRGKIRNYDGKSSVYYQPTIEGIYTPYWKEIKPTTTGVFFIEFENTGLGITTVSYKSIHYRFIHEGNSKIYFELDQQIINTSKRVSGWKKYATWDSLKQIATIKISGDHAEINQFYNKNIRSSYWTTREVGGNYYSYLIYKAESPDRAMTILDSLKEVEFKQINQLQSKVEPENYLIQKKEEEIFRFLTTEVNAFYGAVFLNGMFLKRSKHVYTLHEDSSAKPNIYNRDWEVMVERLVIEAKKVEAIPNSPDYREFIEYVTLALETYKQYYFPQNSVPLDEMVIDRLFHYDTLLISDSKSRFAYELSGLQLYLNDQLFYSPALLHSVYALQKKYPKSAHMDFYKPRIEKLKASLEASQLEFENGKIISSNYGSLKDLLKRFEGKNVLIDIWATWCHPCIEDFKYKSSIQPYRDSLQLEVLYISIDKPEWDDRWRQSIKINQLEGHHFRANNKFINDMWSTIGDLQGAIPRYVLIDRKGSIFKSTAARPSMGNELPSQIAELVNKLD